jgi:hypothetical protein
MIILMEIVPVAVLRASACRIYVADSSNTSNFGAIRT